MEYHLCRLDILTAAVNVLASCKDIQWEYRRSARTRITQAAVDKLHQGQPTRGLQELSLVPQLCMCILKI